MKTMLGMAITGSVERGETMKTMLGMASTGSVERSEEEVGMR